MKSNYKRLGDYIRQVDVRNKDEKVTRLLGVSIDKKFIESIANTIGTDMSVYKIVKHRQFAYGPVTSRNGDKVSIALLLEEECIISSSYTVFEITDTKKLLPEYLNLWFKRPEFDRYARFHSHGSAREIFDWEEMCNVELPVPPIEEQEKIVNGYQKIESRIALKKKINENLENQVNILYRNLTQFKEPNSIFSKIAIIESGKRPTTTNIGPYPLIGAGGVMDYIDVFNYDEPILVTGRVGTHGVIQRLFSRCWASDNTLVIKSPYYEFTYQFLKVVDWSLLNRGSTQPLVTQTDIKNLPIYIPNIDKFNQFEQIAEDIMQQQKISLYEIEKLNEFKDLLISSLSKN